MPTFFIATANTETNPLSSLKEERETIKTTLAPLRREGYNTSIDKYKEIMALSKELVTLQKRILILHYSGHATEDALIIGNASKTVAMQKKGIARILSESKVLKIVFLNGCSTIGQVDTLIKVGVDVVIATHAPIKDNRAKDFSIHFYDYLITQRQSIKEAFKNALGTVESQGIKPKGIIKVEKYKGVGRSDQKILDDETWGLFCTDLKKLDWVLPLDGWMYSHYFSINNPKTMKQPSKAISDYRGYLEMYEDSEFKEEICLDYRKILENIFQDHDWIKRDQDDLIKFKKKTKFLTECLSEYNRFFNMTDIQLISKIKGLEEDFKLWEEAVTRKDISIYRNKSKLNILGEHIEISNSGLYKKENIILLIIFVIIFLLLFTP